MTPVSAEALFREHARFVAAFLVRLGAWRLHVDDLVQEVFLIVHRRGGYVPVSARPTTWLAEIALRVLHNAQRSYRRCRTIADSVIIDSLAARARGPDAAAESAQELTLVQLALDDLDLEHCALFVLHEIEGESCIAIAEGLGIPEGTVHSRLHAARRAFLKAYKRHELRTNLHHQQRGVS